MNFLVDAQLPPALCQWLAGHGHAAVHVNDIDLVGATDAMIADRAEAGNAVLISKDEDFVVLRMPDRFAFLWLRCGNATKAALTAWLDQRWEQIETLLLAGERFVEVR